MDYAAPALFALFTWWFATGIILWLDGLPARTHRWTLLGSTLILIGSAAALYHLRGNTDVVSVYLSFLAVLGIWAWNETTFLLGVLTGPVQRPCPEGARGMERFRAAVDSVLYHEAGLILSGVAIAIITWGESQHFALHLFALLWALRLSTKLNLFFGVPHAPGHFLPEQLRYLATYFRERPVSGLFALTVTLATIAAVLLCAAAGHTPEGSAARAAASFLAAFAVLGVIEHWFLACPIGADHLWRWAFHSHVKTAAQKLPVIPTPALSKVKGAES
jgi:putative photosynthetic complex assembly protein 2